MKLIVDNQLPARLAFHLQGLGHNCIHVLDLNLGKAADVNIWELGKAQGRVVVSKDDDFIFLANRPGDTGKLIWVRLGNCRNTVLIAAFDRIHDQLVAAVDSGQRIIEVR